MDLFHNLARINLSSVKHCSNEKPHSAASYMEDESRSEHMLKIGSEESFVEARETHEVPAHQLLIR
ncbi:hypothetical protein KIN20_019994 [Parelaphostrongylus tenuis]|uniref:Uncharacterized protein n=1 Tax=Parelaphostrongylus tenuis TaxID=148309 RepID=A0AAD5N3N0_PARTN|nr:hypothetical protein KIN20_019994 [Parelaphostrongylus tenuis]